LLLAPGPPTDGLAIVKLTPTALVVATSWAGRIISGISALLVVRPLIQGLGSSQYALYALVVSLTGWYALADFGLSSALQNAVSERRALGRGYEGLVRGVCVLSFGLLTGVILVFALASGPLARVYMVRFQVDEGTKQLALFTGSSLIATSMVGFVAFRVWFAEQRGHLANAVPALGALVGLIAVKVWASFGGIGLLGTFLVVQGPPAAVAVLVMLWRTMRSTGTRLREDLRDAQGLLRKAVGFWGIGVLAAGSLYVDSFVVSQYLSAEDIIAYNVPTRVFDAIKVFYNAVLFALWPTWTELTAKRDLSELGRNIRRSLQIGLISTGVVGLVAIPMMPLVVQVLAPGIEGRVSWMFVAALATFEVIRTWTNTHAIVLVSMGRLWGIPVGLVVQAALSIGLQLLLVPRFGMIGATLGLIGSFLGGTAWIYPWLVRRLVRP